MNYSYIVTACFAETLLMHTLNFNTKNHQNGDGNVINVLSKVEKNQIMIGVMDRPSGIAPSHVQNKFHDIDKGPSNLILKQAKNTRHYIIYIDRLLEEWILRLGKDNRIESPYKSEMDFKNDMKSSWLLENKKIKKYFEEINSGNPSAFVKIKDWVQKIQENKL